MPQDKEVPRLEVFFVFVFLDLGHKPWAFYLLFFLVSNCEYYNCK